MIDVIAFKKRRSKTLQESKEIFRKPKSINEVLKTAEDDILETFKSDCFIRGNSGKIYKGIENLPKAIKEDLGDVDLSKYNVTYLVLTDEDGAIELSIDVMDKETKETVKDAYIRVAIEKKKVY